MQTAHKISGEAVGNGTALAHLAACNISVDVVKGTQLLAKIHIVHDHSIPNLPGQE